MELDVRPFLEKIEQNADAVSEYWEGNARHLHDGKLGNAFWELPNSGHDEIFRWFQSDSVKRIYAEAFGYKI